MTLEPRFLLALRSNRTFVILVAVVLLLCTSGVRAQDPSTQGTSPQGYDGTISGTAYLSGGQPASQVAVNLKSHDAGVFRSVLTDYDGHFEVQGLPPGTYEISIDEQSYEPYRSFAQFDGSSLQLELRLTPYEPAPALGNANTVSARELMIPCKAKDEYRKGLLSLAKQQFTESLSHFAKAVRAFPGYFEAFYHQGVVETDLGHPQEAMHAFQAAATLSGGRYARAEFGIGYLYYLQGNPTQAEAVTRRGLELDPNAADGYVILGMALLRLDRTDEAERSAREALVRNPNDADAYLVLADACARRQNYQEQLQDLDTYLKLNPSGPASKRVQEVRDVAQRILNRLQPPPN